MNLDYGKHGKTTKNTENRRNGSYSKTVIDGDGKKLEIEVQRDRVQVRPSSNVAAKVAIQFLDSLVSLAFVVQTKPFIKWGKLRSNGIRLGLSTLITITCPFTHWFTRNSLIMPIWPDLLPNS